MGDKTSTQIEFKNKYRARAYAKMLMMNLYYFAFLVFLSHFNFRFIHDYKKDHMAVSIIGFIALVILMLIVSYKFKDTCEKNKSKVKQYFWACLFVTLEAFMFAFSGSSVAIYDLKDLNLKVFILSLSSLLGLVISGLSVLYAHDSKEDLGEKYGHYFFNIAIGIIALNLVNNFFLYESNFVNKAISSAFLPLYFASIVICIVLNAQAIDHKLDEIEKSLSSQDEKKIEVQEKVAENFSLFAGLCVFSSTINLFMKIIQIIGEKNESKSHTSVEFFNVEYTIGNIEKQ